MRTEVMMILKTMLMTKTSAQRTKIAYAVLSSWWIFNKLLLYLDFLRDTLKLGKNTYIHGKSWKIFYFILMFIHLF